MSWTLIEHQALSSSAASVTLGSGGTIPQTYKTLKLVISARCDANNASGGYNVVIKPNNATANQTWRQLFGTGSGAGSSTATAIYAFINPSDYTASTFGNSEITIPNYSASANKPISIDSVNENNATSVAIGISAGLWSDSAAITSIVCGAYVGNFVSGSTFTLYGLA